MITFGQDHVVARVEQVAQRRQLRQGARRHEQRTDIRRLLGAGPAKANCLDNLREIWKWRIEGMPPMDETYFGWCISIPTTAGTCASPCGKGRFCGH